LLVLRQSTVTLRGGGTQTELVRMKYEFYSIAAEQNTTETKVLQKI